MTVLVLGARGPVGSAVCKGFSEGGISHIGLSRSGSGKNAIAANRTDTTDILRIISSHGISTIIDVIAYTEADTLNLLEAIDGQIERYVMLSSADVYRNYGLLHGTETGEVSPLLDENAPLRTRLRPYRGTEPRKDNAPDKWMDDYDKIPLEAAAQEMATDWTILRLPMVYGSAGKLDRFSWITKPIRQKARTITATEGWLNWTTTYGYVENIAAAIIHATAHPAAANEVFNIVDHTPITHRAWIAAFVQCADWYGVIETDTSKTGEVAHLDLSVPLKMDGSKLTKLTSFSPPKTRDRTIKEILGPLS